MMGRGLYAKLSEHMIREADWHARARREYAIQLGRVPGNNLRVTADENMALDILGCRCERAGSVFFPTLKWHTELVPDVDEIADLGDFIDVKGISHDSHRLMVPCSRLKRAWAYLLVSAENHPYYWLAGWMWGHEVAEMGEPGPYPHRPCYCIRIAQLHAVYLLQRIAAART